MGDVEGVKPRVPQEVLEADFDHAKKAVEDREKKKRKKLFTKLFRRNNNASRTYGLCDCCCK